MPDQSEHEKEENLVESPNQKVRPARTLQEAVDSNGKLEGYYAINQEEEPPEAEDLDKKA